MTACEWHAAAALTLPYYFYYAPPREPWAPRGCLHPLCPPRLGQRLLGESCLRRVYEALPTPASSGAAHRVSRPGLRPPPASRPAPSPAGSQWQVRRVPSSHATTCDIRAQGRPVCHVTSRQTPTHTPCALLLRVHRELTTCQWHFARSGGAGPVVLGACHWASGPALQTAVGSAAFGSERCWSGPAEGACSYRGRFSALLLARAGSGLPWAGGALCGLRTPTQAHLCPSLGLPGSWSIGCFLLPHLQGSRLQEGLRGPPPRHQRVRREPALTAPWLQLLGTPPVPTRLVALHICPRPAGPWPELRPPCPSAARLTLAAR